MNERDLDVALRKMRDEGVSIIEAIKFVRVEQGIDLGKAKDLVAQHPAYRDIHEAARPLHDELMRLADAGVFGEPGDDAERA